MKMPYTQDLIDMMPVCGTIRQSNVRAERVGRVGTCRVIWFINGNRCSRKDAESRLSGNDEHLFIRNNG